MELQNRQHAAARMHDDGQQIHGAMDRHGCPVAIVPDGRRLRIVHRSPRLDLDTEAMRAGKYRAHWTLGLEDGQQFTIYRDLVQGGWFRLLANPSPR